MGKLMEQYASEMRNDPLFVGSEIGEKERKKVAKDKFKASLQQFIDAQKEGSTFEVIFGYADTEGNLSAVDESGVKVILRAEDLKADLDYYRGWIKDKFVGMAFTAVVSSIDEEEGIVYVKNGRGNEMAGNVRMMRELDREIKKGERPIVPGRVVSVKENAIFVDICGAKVLGICYIKNWSKAYTRNMKKHVQVGEIMEFVVDEKIKRKGAGVTAYSLNRKDMTLEPWEQIPKDMFEANSVILVQCVDKPYGKPYWWGKSNMVPDIEIMGNYNDKFEGGVMQGVTYKCKVREIDVEKKRFRVAPFEPVQSVALTNVFRFRNERPKKAIV